MLIKLSKWYPGLIQVSWFDAPWLHHRHAVTPPVVPR